MSTYFKMTNFLIGGLISAVLSVVCVMGNFLMFTFADHNQSITAVLPKVSPYALNNLGKFPQYIAVKCYNKKFSDTGKHADLIRLLSNKKKGAVLLLWTPTCPKCKAQLKSLANISKKYSHVQFVAVVTTFGSKLEDARNYWQKYVGSDHNMILVEDDARNPSSIFKTVFNMTNQPAVPTIVFLNQKMEVLSAVTGNIKWEQHGGRLMSCKFEQ